jgi:hypothetical protein
MASTIFWGGIVSERPIRQGPNAQSDRPGSGAQRKSPPEFPLLLYGRSFSILIT